MREGEERWTPEKIATGQREVRGALSS